MPGQRYGNTPQRLLAAGSHTLPDADAPAPRRVDTSHAVLRADAGGDMHDSAPKLLGRSAWKYAVEQLPLAEVPAGRAARMELKDESRTRALVQSRGGGLQPKMQDLESGSGASGPPPPFRMAWISAAMGSVALHMCSPSLPLQCRRTKSRQLECTCQKYRAVGVYRWRACRGADAAQLGKRRPLACSNTCSCHVARSTRARRLLYGGRPRRRCKQLLATGSPDAPTSAWQRGRVRLVGLSRPAAHPSAVHACSYTESRSLRNGATLQQTYGSQKAAISAHQSWHAETARAAQGPDGGRIAAHILAAACRAGAAAAQVMPVPKGHREREPQMVDRACTCGVWGCGG